MCVMLFYGLESIKFQGIDVITSSNIKIQTKVWINSLSNAVAVSIVAYNMLL